MKITSRLRVVLVASISLITIASFSPLPAALAQPSSEVAAASERMSELSAELETSSNELAQIEASVEETKAAIEEHQLRIHDLKAELDDAQDDLAACVKDSYINGNDSYLSVLLGAESFSDFTSRLYYLEQVASSHAETIDYVMGLTSEIDEETAALNETLAEQEQLLADAQSRTASIESSLEEQQQIVDSLSADELAQVNANNDTGYTNSGNSGNHNGGGNNGGGNNGGGNSGGGGNTGGGGNNGGGGGNSGGGGGGGNLGGGHPAAADVAYGYLGCRYVYGAAGPNTFDCSGLCYYCFRQIGVSIPRVSYDQYYGTSRHPSRNQLQPGDLVFFNGFGHVGIYIGGGQYIHAPMTGDVVKISNMSSRGDYCGAARW